MGYGIGLFETDRLMFRQKVFKLFGAEFRIMTEDGELLGISRQKAFKLKEDIRIYADPSCQEEVLLIKARQILDFAAAYDVMDPQRGSHYGTLRRKGFASIIRDTWEIANPEGEQIGQVLEDSTSLAILRRTIAGWLPQKYRIIAHDQLVGTVKQRFNPFVFKCDVRFEPGSDELLPRPVTIAAVVLLMAIESRQG
jgi:hypothetical protein